MTEGTRQIRILLSDDHLLVRDGLKRLINDQADMKVVAETADGQEALQLVQVQAPDVALVDVSMPGWDGVRLAKEMSRAAPSLKIIAVTRHDDPGFVKKMIDAGACGYVLKQTATSRLVEAVRVCVGGALYIDPGVRSHAPADASRAVSIVAMDGEPLTSLEHDVLHLFGSAFGLQAIADQLGLERKEAERVKDTAMRKAGLHTRLQAIQYVRALRKNEDDAH